MRHISIEGMDGVGKTTLSNRIAEKLGYKFVEKPLHYLFDKDERTFSEYLFIRDKVNADSDRLFTSWFYALGTIYMYSHFDGGIVTDRHILSNWAWSGTDESKDVLKFLLSKIGSPYKTIILYSTPEAIRKRMMGRDSKDPDLKKIGKSDAIYKKMIEFALAHDMDAMVLNSSDLDADETFRTAMEYLESDKKGVIFESPVKTGENHGHFIEFTENIERP